MTMTDTSEYHLTFTLTLHSRNSYNYNCPTFEQCKEGITEGTFLYFIVLAIPTAVVEHALALHDVIYTSLVLEVRAFNSHVKRRDFLKINNLVSRHLKPKKMNY